MSETIELLPTWFKLVAQRQKEKMEEKILEEVKRFERKFNVIVDKSDVHEKVFSPFVSIEKELSTKIELLYGMSCYLRLKVCNKLRFAGIIPTVNVNMAQYDDIDRIVAEELRKLFEGEIVELNSERYCRLAVKTGDDFIIVAEYRTDC
ncbi:MAG: hypothetical protein QXS37_06755 [Candidatus Aenigmatarchaeota archaeon]